MSYADDVAHFLVWGRDSFPTSEDHDLVVAPDGDSYVCRWCDSKTGSGKCPGNPRKER